MSRDLSYRHPGVVSDVKVDTGLVNKEPKYVRIAVLDGLDVGVVTAVNLIRISPVF